jgi:hypothetical protein
MLCSGGGGGGGGGGGSCSGSESLVYELNIHIHSLAVCPEVVLDHVSRYCFTQTSCSEGNMVPPPFPNLNLLEELEPVDSDELSRQNMINLPGRSRVFHNLLAS